MNSLNARLLLAASIVLAAFLSLTGFALDRAFADSGIVAVKEKLQTEIYSLLAAAYSDGMGELLMPRSHPDSRFSTPTSGLYAQITSDEGKVIWRSRSMVGITIPFKDLSRKGKSQFSELDAGKGVSYYTLSLGVSWEVASYVEKGFTFHVAETQAHFKKERDRFRNSLAVWLGAAVIALLVVQAAILRWGLAPLRKVAGEITDIEAGRKTELSSGYPQEIESLAKNLNMLIRSSNSHLKRYRNALGDLAHSIKTPLAVLHNVIESDDLPKETQETISEQVKRLDKTVEYQLHKAVASGRQVLAAPVDIRIVVKKLLNTFKKVHVDKQINFRLSLYGELEFIGDEGDLLEILGNLIDNACKWTVKQVHITAFITDDQHLKFIIEDDGPGIPIEERSLILKRGVRGDSQVEGHGIGMAVVRNLVEEVYEGELSIESSNLGGAKMVITLKK